MYVPGKMLDTKNVIIDIGTRYYAQKVSLNLLENLVLNVMFQDIDSAKDYFKRKMTFVTEQMEKIQILGLEKSKIRDAIVEVMEMKLAQQGQA